MNTAVNINAVAGVPDIEPGDDLAVILGDCLVAQGGLVEGDIVVLAHKIVSKAEGNVIDLGEVEPSEEALKLASELGKDPAKVEVVLSQSSRVVRAFRRPDQDEGTLICEHRLGFISANAAVDQSNVAGENHVITLPDDPDASAQRIGQALEARFGVAIGLVITDTFGRPWRLGQVNVAIGLYRVPALASEIGQVDGWGRPLSVTEPALADEISAASGLVMAKAARTPMILMRGLDWHADAQASARDILRESEKDMFK